MLTEISAPLAKEPLRQGCNALISLHSSIHQGTNLEIAFGKKKWAMYLGDIGEEPPLPQNIDEILKGPCPVFPGKTFAETHLLILIPSSVERRLLNLISLTDLVKSPEKGNQTDCQFGWNDWIRKLCNKTVDKSYWMLMTKNVLKPINNSYWEWTTDFLQRSKNFSPEESYAYHCNLVTSLAKKAQLDYQVPKVLEAAVCILTTYVSSGKRLYNDSPLKADQKSFIWCQGLEDCSDKVSTPNWRRHCGAEEVLRLSPVKILFVYI